MIIKKHEFYFSPDADTGSGTAVTETETQEPTDNTEQETEKKSDAEVFYGKEESESDEGQATEEEAETENTDEEQAEDSAQEGEGEDKPEVDDFGFKDFEVKEGFEVTDEAKELFKGLELDQENSQKLVDYGIKIQEQTIQTIAEAQEAEAAKQKEAWDAEIKENFSKELPIAQEFVQKHTSEEFIGFLNETGLGNHPQMVGLMANIAKSVSEDSFDKAPSSPTEKPKPTGAQVLYGDKYD